MSTQEYNKIVDEQESMIDHRKFISPKHNPEIPTSSDYKQGKFIRYFVISETDQRVVEVDDRQHLNVPLTTKGISPFLWKPVLISWKLKGPRYDIKVDGVMQKRGVIDVNREAVSKIAKSNPKFPKAIIDLTLFASIDEIIQENITAESGLLVYTNNPGIDYIGLYHIHPSKGPMAGAYHKDAPHELLRYKAEILEELPKPDTSDTSYESPVYGGSSDGGSSGGGSSGGY